MANKNRKPLLELSTLRERIRYIAIDGEEYTLHDPASMGVKQHAIVFHAATEFQRLGSSDDEFDAENAKQMLDLITDAAMQVVDAPLEVIENLTVPQMVQIIDVFSEAAGLATPPEEKPKRKSRSTGEKSSPSSKDSTVASPTPG